MAQRKMQEASTTVSDASREVDQCRATADRRAGRIDAVPCEGFDTGAEARAGPFRIATEHADRGAARAQHADEARAHEAGGARDQYRARGRHDPKVLPRRRVVAANPVTGLQRRSK